jgi:hypothetical protein
VLDRQINGLLLNIAESIRRSSSKP